MDDALVYDRLLDLLDRRGFPIRVALDTNVISNLRALPHEVFHAEDAYDIPDDLPDRDEVQAAFDLLRFHVEWGRVVPVVPLRYLTDSSKSAVGRDGYVEGMRAAALLLEPDDTWQLDDALDRDTEPSSASRERDTQLVMESAASGCDVFVTGDRQLIRRTDLPDAPIRCLPTTLFDAVTATAVDDLGDRPAPDLLGMINILDLQGDE